MRVIGVDPGIARMGYGVVEDDQGRMARVISGCISTSQNMVGHDRLLNLYHGIAGIIKDHKPEGLVLENLFFNRNVTTAIKVGEARGVILLAAAENRLKVAEYTPLQVKQAVCGYGRATKKQVQKLVSLQLGIDEKYENDDEADALAIALCYLHQRKWLDAVKRSDKH